MKRTQTMRCKVMSVMPGDIPKFAHDLAKVKPFTNSGLFSLLPNIPKDPPGSLALSSTCFGAGSSFNGSNPWSRSGRHFYRNRWKLLGDLDRGKQAVLTRKIAGFLWGLSCD